MIETPETPPEGPATSRRRWLSLSVAVGLLLMMLASYPGYLLWQQRHLASLIHQAQVHLDSEQWEQAHQVLVKAYRQAPTNPEVLQKIARLTQRTNPDPARALFFWKQLITCGTPTMEDWAEMGKAYLADNQPEEVTRIIDSFSPEQKASRHALYLQSQLLYFKGDTIEADDLYRQFLLTSPRDPESELNLALLDLDDPFAEVQQNSFAVLWKIARSGSRLSVRALQAIAQSPLLSPGNSAELVELARESKGLPAKNYYEILRWHLVLHPQESDAAYASEISRYQNRSIQESAPLYHWLLQQQEYDRVMKLVPRENAMRSDVLFPVYIEALAGKEQWAELVTILRKSPAIPLSPTDQSVLQARIAHGLKDRPEIVSGHLKEASRRAITSNHIEALQKIITIAEELGFDEVAIDALNKASSIPRYQVEMLERLLGIYTQQGDIDAMLATLQRILEARPMMQSHLERTLYLKLLLGREMESIPYDAAQLLKQGRISTAAGAFLNSLSAYRFQDQERLKGLLAQVMPDSLSTGQRAVYAGMLASCGEQAGAYIIAEKIPPILLLEGELTFLHKAL